MAVILAVLILVPTVAFAQCSETGYMPEDNNFYISGNVPDGTEGDAITLLLRDSDGNIKYVKENDKREKMKSRISEIGNEIFNDIKSEVKLCLIRPQKYIKI